MSTNTGSIPVVGPDPDAHHERAPHVPDVEVPSDLSPPPHVQVTLPPDMPESDDALSPGIIYIAHWEWPDRTPLHYMSFDLPDLPVKQRRRASHQARARTLLALIVVIISLGTPTAMALMHYPSDQIFAAAASGAAPTTLVLGYYFGKKLIDSRKKKQ